MSFQSEHTIVGGKDEDQITTASSCRSISFLGRLGVIRLAFLTVILVTFILQTNLLLKISGKKDSIFFAEMLNGLPSVTMTTTTDDEVKSIEKSKMKQDRRRKLHHCLWWAHSGTPGKMLKEELGFKVTDASVDDDWDLIFGGYPHCGTKKWDWKMETGLNAKLREKGWDSLKPHQVWHPCMGCANSFCDKRELCRIQQKLDPNSCYILPDDKDKVLSRMKSDATKLWVLKRDAPDLHMHKSTGVKVIDSPTKLPDDEQMKDGTYLVQPYAEPFVGEGQYRRKSELRFYITITSIVPFRVYSWSTPWVSLSQTLYETNHKNSTDSELAMKCMHDSHTHMRQCEKVGSQLPKNGLGPRFADYCARVNISETMQQSILDKSKAMLVDVFKSSKATLAANEVNRGIAQSGASCFSFMRADFGISQDMKPYLYEINEFPFANEKLTAGEVQKAAWRDLFTMIGLADTPIPPQDRAEYELAHKGAWEALPL